MAEIIFKIENICKRFDIGKDMFYLLSSLPNTPLKKLGGRRGIWVCNVEDMARFVSEYPAREIPR